MLAQNPAIEGGGVDAKALSHEVTEAGGVQVGAAANDAVLWQATQLPGDVGQHINYVYTHTNQRVIGTSYP